MQFTRYNYPVSFKMLKQELLLKAIEIGNCLLHAGYKENVAETIAISTAKLWVCYLPDVNGGVAKRTNLHLVPHPKGWALISADASSFYFVCGTRNDALTRSRVLAKNEKLKLYIHSPAGNISDSESFVVNRPVLCEESTAPDTKAWAVKTDLVKPSLVDHTRREAVKKAKGLAKKIKNNVEERSLNSFSFDA